MSPLLFTSQTHFTSTEIIASYYCSLSYIDRNDQFWFQLMHHNFTLLTKSLYMFRAHTCPSSGGKNIHTPQLVQRHLQKPYRWGYNFLPRWGNPSVSFLLTLTRHLSMLPLIIFPKTLLSWVCKWPLIFATTIAKLQLSSFSRRMRAVTWRWLWRRWAVTCKLNLTRSLERLLEEAYLSGELTFWRPNYFFNYNTSCI